MYKVKLRQTIGYEDTVLAESEEEAIQHVLHEANDNLVGWDLVGKLKAKAKEAPEAGELDGMTDAEIAYILNESDTWPYADEPLDDSGEDPFAG